MTNRYPGKCSTCQSWVGAEQGEYRGGRVYCAAHAAVTPAVATAARIRLSLAADGSGKVACAPAGYLGSDKFAAYRDACQAGGATYNGSAGSAGANVCSLDAAPRLIAALTAAGFAIDADPALTARLQAKAAQASLDLTGAAQRVDTVNAALAARGLALFPFQATGVSWLAPRTGALLCDDMGLGKTIQALTAAPAGAPLLVVCPAVAKGVWVREAASWRADLRPVLLSGRNSFRWPMAGELVVTNYDILPTPDELVALGAPPAGVVVIADEAHALKNYKAARSRKFGVISEAARKQAGGRTWLLTATPLLNQPFELWSVLQAAGVERDVFGSFAGFTRAFNGYQGQYGWELGQADATVGPKLQRVMLRRLKTEVMTDLPAKTRRHLPVNGLSVACKALCDKALLAIAKRGKTLDEAIDHAAATAGGVGFEEMSAARAALAAAKLPHVLALVEDYEAAGEPVVVFSAHRAPIDALASREGWAVITGDTAAAERTAIEAKFQAGQLKGVAATIQAGGVAITLTRASHAIFVDQAWTPALNSQAEDRIHRIGTVRPVLITVLVAAHALDERIAQLLAEKQALIAGSVDAARAPATATAPAPSPAFGDAVAALDAAADQLTATLAAEAQALAGAAAARAVETAPDLDIALDLTECPF